MDKKPEPTYHQYENEDYEELSTVQSQRNEILQVEFPEGPYGAATNGTLGKSTEWEKGQHSTSTRFTYETRRFHEGLYRGEPSSHPPHSDPETDEEPL